jgi:hypothetical protein
MCKRVRREQAQKGQGRGKSFDGRIETLREPHPSHRWETLNSDSGRRCDAMRCCGICGIDPIKRASKLRGVVRPLSALNRIRPLTIHRLQGSFKLPSLCLRQICSASYQVIDM